MKKRIWSKAVSIFTAILLVVGIVPNTTITALAADGDTVYVGGVALTGSTGSPVYATTDTNGNVSSGGNESSYNIKWDGSTLTLHNATIKESVSMDTSTLIAGAAIGVLNQSGDANLTITLEGDNTIAEVGKGIYVLASSTGGATLTITGGGSLNASGSVNSGIYVQSNTGNGTLAITGAKVTASSSKGANGVHIQCGVSSNASLTVNGGSLTATATGSNSGINFLFGSGVSGSGTPSLNVSNSAIVKASGDTGGITSNSSPVTPSGTGIVFNNGTGTVYGDVTLDESLTINQGETLIIRDGASLNTGNNKVTVNGGTLNGEDKITGTVKYTPSITTASLPEGKVNEEYATSLSANGSEPITWNVTDGNLPTGLNLSTNGKITGIPTAPGDYVFTVTASNDVGSVS